MCPGRSAHCSRGVCRAVQRRLQHLYHTAIDSVLFYYSCKVLFSYCSGWRHLRARVSGSGGKAAC